VRGGRRGAALAPPRLRPPLLVELIHYEVAEAVVVLVVEVLVLALEEGAGVRRRLGGGGGPGRGRRRLLLLLLAPRLLRRAVLQVVLQLCFGATRAGGGGLWEQWGER